MDVYAYVRSFYFREYVAGMTSPLTYKIARNLYRAAGAKARWYVRNHGHANPGE